MALKKDKLPQDNTIKSDKANRTTTALKKDELSQGVTTKSDLQIPDVPTGTLKKDELSQDVTTKSDQPNKPTTAMKKDGVDLKKESVREVIPVKVDMEHLFDCLTMDIESAVRPSIKLLCHFDDEQWNKQWGGLCLRVLGEFFLSWANHIKPHDGFPKEKCNEFVDLFKKKIDLFEKFFPLSKKHRLFAEKSLEIIAKNKSESKFNIKNNDQRFHLARQAFSFLLEKTSLCPYDIFEKPDDFLSFLKIKDYEFHFFLGFKKSKKLDKEYKSFENDLRKLLEDIKNQNIVEDKQNIKDKIQALANSSLHKNSISGEKSFFDVVKNDIYKSESLTEEERKRIRKFWTKSKEFITNNIVPIKISASDVFINDSLVPEQYIPAVREFLGSVIEEKGEVVLGKWDSTKLPSDSKIRQGLVAVALTSLAASCVEPDWFFDNKKRADSLNNLRHAFEQLTKEERMAVMCTEVKFEEKSFPLSPLLFSNYWYRPHLIGIIKDFVPEVLDAGFQINEKGEECGIIQLLEEADSYFKKPENKDVYEEKNPCFFSFSRNLDLLIYRLKKTREQLNSQKNEIQEPQASEEKPSTLVHQVEKEKAICAPVARAICV